MPPTVRDVLRSAGRPIDPHTRAVVESRFGRDFSRVRIHADADAARSARALRARAYTVGHHIVFGADKYAPATDGGRELLGHELAHTIQQRDEAAPAPSGDPRGAVETSATGARRALANATAVPVAFPATGIGVARAPDEPTPLEEAFDDAELAEELRRLAEQLQEPHYPGRYWDVDRFERLEQERVRRGSARVPPVARPAREDDEPTAPAVPGVTSLLTTSDPGFFDRQLIGPSLDEDVARRIDERRAKRREEDLAERMNAAVDYLKMIRNDEFIRQNMDTKEEGRSVQQQRPSAERGRASVLGVVFVRGGRADGDRAVAAASAGRICSSVCRPRLARPARAGGERGVRNASGRPASSRRGAPATTRSLDSEWRRYSGCGTSGRRRRGRRLATSRERCSTNGSTASGDAYRDPALVQRFMDAGLQVTPGRAPYYRWADGFEEGVTIEHWGSRPTDTRPVPSTRRT